MINQVDLLVDTVGGAGAASGSSQFPVAQQGFIDAVFLSYHSAIPANSHAVIRELGGEVILSATASGWFYPRRQAHTSAGALIAGWYDNFAVRQPLTLAVDTSDAQVGAVVAKIYMCD